MRGEKGLLVLDAPLTWWPQAKELHRHPLDARRSFFSAITNTGVAVGAAEPVAALSRLGKSVVMSGVLTASSVRFYNPFSGGDITLCVRPELSQHAISSGASLRDLAEADCVRIHAAPIVAPHFVVEADATTSDEKHVTTALNYIVEHLQSGRRPEVCSVLFTGEHGVGKTHIMRRVTQRVPPIVNLHDVHYVVERRDVSIARLLQMSEQEAVMMIRCVFAVPPVESASGAHAVLLLVTLDGVDLLWAASNSLVALVSHQLCAALDELHDATRSASCRGVVLAAGATATTLTTVPAALLSRLSLRRLHVVRQLPRDCVDRAGGGGGGGGCVEDAYRGLVGVHSAVRDLEDFAVWPLLHLPLLRRCGVAPPRGVLLCGPPGCGKTALLTALAARLRGGGGVHVMFVDGLALIEKEVGRTEKNIAALFSTARAMSPAALFLDNIDGLAPPRGRQMSEVSLTADRTLSTLLTQMDGISSDCSSTVFVIASAPNVDALDPAIRRPGRLDFCLSLSLPNVEDLRLYLVQRVLACVAEFGDHGNAEVTAEMSPVVEEYVERWTAAGHLSLAEANAFVREFVLNMAEKSDACLMDRLQDSLANAVSL